MKLKSSSIALFMNFQVEHILNPWILKLDLNEQSLTVEKRNWYLIGKDRNTIAFRFVRSVKVNEHLFGADVVIRVVGGTIEAKYLKKREVRRLKQVLMEYNSGKTGFVFS